MAPKQEVKNTDALVTAFINAPSLAACARIISMDGRQFRTVVRSFGTFVGGSHGEDNAKLTDEVARKVIARPSVAKRALAAGYTLDTPASE